MTGRAASALAATETMARAGKTFHQAARLLPAQVREPVVLLYAFCRAVDDIADDAHMPVQEREARLLQVLHALASADTAELARCGWLLGNNRQRLAMAAILVRAALGDLRQVQPATEDDVLLYAFGVAGSVGLLMADVLQAAPEGMGAAVALGCAMQLTNICRDVAEDFRDGRVYLPADAVAADVLARALTGHDAEAQRAVRTATHRLLQRAEALYAAACDGMWSLPARSRWSILVAAMCYRQIGIKVGADVERSWRVRTVVSQPQKLRLMVWASMRLLHPRFWRPRFTEVWPRSLGRAVAGQARSLGAA